MNIYPFIEAEKSGGHHVSRACALLQVSRAAYYAHRSGPSARERADAELTAQITAVYHEPKRWKTTTIPDPTAVERADLIRRDFTADATAINARWCGDPGPRTARSP